MMTILNMLDVGKIVCVKCQNERYENSGIAPTS